MVEAHGNDEAQIARMRRAYRMTFAASVTLAAVGAPLLMQGAVAFAASFAEPTTSSGSGSVLQGLVLFALSCIPMGLAGFAWRRTQEFQQSLDREPN